MRIKLPGSPKLKKVILVILIVISVCIIGKTAIDNRKEANIRAEKQKEEKERIEQEEEQERIAEEEKQKKAREDELYNKAYDLFHNKKYSEAITAANDLLAEFEDSYRGYSIKGIAEGYNGNFDEGMKDIDKSLEINPDYGYGRFNKALLYELNQRFDDSLSWYDKALEIEKYMWSYYGKASIYGRKGAVDEAVSNLQLAINAASSDEEKKALKETAKNEEDFDPISGDKKFQEAIK